MSGFSFDITKNLASSIRKFMGSQGNNDVSEVQMNSILSRMSEVNDDRKSGKTEGGSIFSGGNKYLGGDGTDFVVQKGQKVNLSEDEYNKVFDGFLSNASTKPKAEAPKADTSNLGSLTQSKPADTTGGLSDDAMKSVKDQQFKSQLQGMSNKELKKFAKNTTDAEQLKLISQEYGVRGDQSTARKYAKQVHEMEDKAKAEVKPAETKPAETKPTETKPAETTSTEAKPAETKPEGKEVTAQTATDKAVTGVDDPQYEADMKELMNKDTKTEGNVATAQTATDKAVTGVDDPQYEADMKELMNKDTKTEGQVVTAQRSPEAPVTGVDTPEYEAARTELLNKDTKPVETTSTETKPAETKPAETKPKSNGGLSNDDIQNKISALKPGESFNYKGSGYTAAKTPISWTRNDDNTLTKNHLESLYQNGLPKAVKLSSHYEADGQTLISKDVVNTKLDAVTTQNYENGKLSSATTDLSKFENRIGDRGAMRLLNAANPKLAQSRGITEQRFMSNSNKELVSIKDGKYYNQNGKEIEQHEADEILTKAMEKGQLGSLYQQY